MFGSLRRRFVVDRAASNRTVIQVRPCRDGSRDTSVLCNQVLATIDRCRTNVVVDLRHLRVVSSSFVATLLLGWYHLRQAGLCMRVTNLSKQAQSVLSIHGACRVLTN